MREAQRRRELEEQRNKRIDLDNPKNPWGMLAQNWGRKESQEEDRIDYQALLRKHTKGGGGRPFFLGFYLLSFRSCLIEIVFFLFFVNGRDHLFSNVFFIDIVLSCFVFFFSLIYCF